MDLFWCETKIFREKISQKFYICIQTFILVLISYSTNINEYDIKFIIDIKLLKFKSGDAVMS